MCGPSDFHVYAVEWSENEIRWFFDGKEYHKFSRTNVPTGSKWVFDHPFFIIINFAVGGKWPGSPDRKTKFPQSMLVDYVRATRRPLKFLMFEVVVIIFYANLKKLFGSIRLKKRPRPRSCLLRWNVAP